MSTTAIAAYGCQLQRYNGATYDVVAEVTKISAPALKLDTADTSSDPITGTFTVTGSSTTMTIAAANVIPVGMVFQFTTTGTLPAGLSLATDYWVLSRSGTTVTVSASLGGTAVTFADTGTGTHTFTQRASWRTQIGTLKDGGEVVVDLNYVPSNAVHGYSGLIGDLTGKTVQLFKVVFSDSGTTTWPFSALVTSFKPSAPVAGALMAAVTFKLTGQPTLV